MIKCWFHRRTISRCADENTALPPSAQAHVAGCPACRRHHQAESQIVRRLTARAVRRQDPPPFLRARIMAQVTRESDSTVRPQAGKFVVPPLGGRESGSEVRGRLATRRLLFTAFAAACLVLTIILLWPAHSPPSGVQVAKVHPPTPSAPNPTVTWPNATQLTQWAVHPDQPLETEMHAVLHDARGAVTALADNFFPEKLRQTLLASAQN
jgi:hypothetical protein